MLSVPCKKKKSENPSGLKKSSKKVNEGGYEFRHGLLMGSTEATAKKKLQEILSSSDITPLDLSNHNVDSHCLTYFPMDVIGLTSPVALFANGEGNCTITCDESPFKFCTLFLRVI